MSSETNPLQAICSGCGNSPAWETSFGTALCPQCEEDLLQAQNLDDFDFDVIIVVSKDEIPF